MKTKTLLTSLAIALLLAGTVSTSSCRTKGPMEKAGDKIDDAVGDVKDGVEEAADDVKDATN